MAQVPTTDVTTISVGGSAYTVPFLYQNQAEVFVEVDGVATAFTWINSGNISITPAPVAGAKVRRYRSTAATSIRHDFRNGVPFTPKNITENNDQLLYVVQEAVNDTAGTADAALTQAEQAVATADAAAGRVDVAVDLIDAALQDSALYLRNDLANATDPAKGAGMVGRSSVTVESLAELAALPRNRKLTAQLVLGGRSGTFVFASANLVAEVTADPLQGLYVAHASDPTGASGAWVRQYGQAFLDGGTINVQWFGAKGDDVSDDLVPLQHCFDRGGAVFMPPGKYVISSCLQIRHNKQLSLFGPQGNRPQAIIYTAPNFASRSMVRQWDESWYAAGETDRDVPPANLTAYSNLLDRYVNLRHIGFSIRGGAADGGEITCLDFVSLQESSRWEGLVFSGSNDVEKGWPVRIRSTPAGGEISVNGFSVLGVVCYSNKWRGQFLCSGKGSDFDIDTWVTAQTESKGSPFIFGLIDTTLRNIHCEAHAVGLPTVKTSGDLTVSNSFFVIQNLQGGVFDADTASGVFSLSNINIYPVGGNIANVTNRDSILLIKDAKGPLTATVPLVLRNDNNIINKVISYCRGRIDAVTGTGHSYVITGQSASLKLNATSSNSATSIEIPYNCKASQQNANHFVEVVLMGRRVSSGGASILKVRITKNDNFAGFAPKAASIIENVNWPGVVTVAFVGDYPVISTDDAQGVTNISATIYAGTGPAQFGGLYTSAIQQ